MLPGERFERYTIEGVLGTGGMGCVYKAHDPKLGRDVAIKVLLEKKAADGSSGPTDEAKARILREARAAAALSHPNAVSIYDVGESESGGPYIVMELVSGQSLRDMIRSPTVSTADKIRWLKETAGALAAAHDRGIVHRDVKPENVLVRTDGVAKVLDFGIARRAAGAADPSAPTEASLPTLTEVGTQIGTPLYMAPEQIKGDPVDGRSDQFAWGVVAYELFTGKLPWRIDKGQLGVAASILTETPPPLTDVPAEVAAVVKRALSKDPADRFASMRDVIAAFDGASAEPSVARTSDPPTSRTSRPERPSTSDAFEPSKPGVSKPSDDPRRYDTEQLKEIFQRALERQEADGRYEHEDLVSAAREMGIRDDVLEKTIAEADLEVQRDKLALSLEAEDRRRGIRRFWRLAISFALGNGILFFMAHTWNKWLIYATVIGLLIQLRNTYFPSDRTSRNDRRERRRERREERRAKKADGRGTRDSDARIEEGVRILLSTTQKRAGKVRVANVPSAASDPAPAPEDRDAQAEEEALAEEQAGGRVRSKKS